MVILETLFRGYMWVWVGVGAYAFVYGGILITLDWLSTRKTKGLL